MTRAPGLRVLHVTSSFPRWPGDHQARFLADLVTAQAEVGLRPSVLAPHGPGLAGTEKHGAVPVRRFRYGPSRLESLAYRGGLTTRARTAGGAVALPSFFASFIATVRRAAHDFDVIHAHWWLPAGLVSAIAPIRRSVPVVITCHGSDVELLGRGALGRVGAKVLRSAAVVGAVSAPLAEMVTAATGIECRVLRMPLPLEDAPRSTAPPGPPWRLLCVGRLSPEKGFDIAIRAVRRAMEQGMDVDLRIIGEGPMRAELVQLAAAAPAGWIRIDAPVGPAQLAQAIAASHAVLAPSRHEGLGLVALEALGRGRPVIASAVGGLVDVVAAPEDGLLVPPDDADALAAALSRLPLPEPSGQAVARHAPALVAEEHRVAYEDALIADVGRRRAGSTH